MSGTTISTAGTVGVDVTQVGEDPVLITSSGVIQSAGGYAVRDAISPATVTNFGTIQATAQTGRGIEITSGGSVANSGVLTGGGVGVFVGGLGTVTNFGSIAGTTTGSATASTGVSFSGGTVTNGSTAVTGLAISGGGDGVHMNDTSGTVYNFGTVTGSLGYGVEIDNDSGGTDLVINGAGIGTSATYLIQGDSDGVYLGAGGLVQNRGTIVGTRLSGVSIGSGNVANGDATHVGRSISGGSSGIYVSSGLGTVTNFGSIAGIGVGSATASTGASFADGGTVTNGSTAVTGLAISGGGDGVQMKNTSGTVYNFGTVTGSMGYGVEIDNRSGGTDLVVNGAGIGTSATYLIQGDTDGVLIGTSGLVQNQGTIVGSTLAGVSIGSGDVANGDATHVGRSISGGSFGIDVFSGLGTVTNFGSIAGTAVGSATASTGVLFSDGGTLTNGSTAVTGLAIGGGGGGVQMIHTSGTVYNFGTVTGSMGYGVEIDNADGGIDLVTNGAGIGTSATYLIRGDIDGVYLGAGGLVQNQGTIVGTTLSGVSIGSGDVANGDATHTGRSISGGSSGIDVFSGLGTVTNFGSIAGTAVGSATASTGVLIADGGTVTNGSTAVTGLAISGGGDGVQMIHTSGTVDNFGTVIGSMGYGVEIDNADGGIDLVTNGAGIGTSATYLIQGAGDGVYLGGGGTVQNQGTIVGTALAGVSVGSGDVNNGDATHTGRSISGGSSGIDVFSGLGTVTNFGSIAGTTMGSATASTGVLLAGGGTVTNGSAAVTGLAISGGGDGVQITNNVGTVYNFGTVTGSMGNGVEIDNGGRGGVDLVINDAGGSISGTVGILLNAAATVVNAGTITGTGGTAIQFAGSENTLMIDPGAVFNGVVDGGAGNNTIELGSGSGSATALGTDFTNFGNLAVGATAAWSLSGTNSIGGVLNDGTITIAASGSLDVSASVAISSDGVFDLSAGASLEIAADAGSSVGIAFLGTAQLVVDSAAHFGSGVGTAAYAGPQIEDFAAGDEIDLLDVVATGATLDYSSGSGLLEVTNGSAVEATLLFQASTLASGTLQLGQDTSGHAVVEEVASAPCFMRGTRVLTLRGEVPVEALCEGDHVVTLLNRTTVMPTAKVKWIGHRALDCRKHSKPVDVWPVRVSTGAFGEGQPHRDLLLSPDHAVFVDGALIPIRYLVNGSTIVQERRGKVSYWHVELDRHSVMLAEGLPCESYLDTGNRGAFANGGDALHLHPDFAMRIWETQSCVPLALGGPQVARARLALLERAAEIGCVVTTDPDFRVKVDEQELRPRIEGQWQTVDLPRRTRRVRLLSRSGVPGETRVSGADQRRLGVAVRRVTLDGQPVALEGRSIGRGWHAREGDGLGWRWTNGDACLAVSGGGALAVEIVMTESYWTKAVPSSSTSVVEQAVLNGGLETVRRVSQTDQGDPARRGAA